MHKCILTKEICHFACLIIYLKFHTNTLFVNTETRNTPFENEDQSICEEVLHFLLFLTLLIVMSVLREPAAF